MLNLAFFVRATAGKTTKRIFGHSRFRHGVTYGWVQRKRLGNRRLRRLALLARNVL